MILYDTNALPADVTITFNQPQRTVPMIKTVLEFCSDSEVATHAVWALAYISGDEDALDNVMEQSAMLTKLVAWVG
jgi:hypothetical protein